MSRYQVVVGNIGTVYDGDDREQALRDYREYLGQSQTGYGRAAQESVTLFEDDDIWVEYSPPFEPDEREKYEDDGQEYADPRDFRDERDRD